jgi:hypothetical protein
MEAVMFLRNVGTSPHGVITQNTNIDRLLLVSKRTFNIGLPEEFRGREEV